MSKTIWDKFAPIYSLTMKSQKNIYNYMYSHIGEAVMGKRVERVILWNNLYFDILKNT